MLRFNPMLASQEFLLELSEDLWASQVDEIQPRVGAHGGAFAITGHGDFALPGNWDLYLVSTVGGTA